MGRTRSIGVLLTGAILSFAPMEVQAQSKDDAGQVAFNTHCRNCHSIKPGDNRLGPSLHGVYGGPAGQVKGFANYSGGLTPDIKWDDATLDKFLTNPTAMVSNTTMKPFGGVNDPEQRRLIIEYLKANKG